jgi:SpoVK/Ycf46/Vps4 family AAA+-type ATPase
MNLEAIGAITEVLGVIAVAITLVYLARQLHQNNQLLNEQASYNMLQNQLSYYDGLAREPELVNVVYGIPKTNKALTMRKKAESHATAEFFRWHWEFLKIRGDSVLTDWSDLPIQGFRREWERADFGQYWDEQKRIFNPDFVTFIDAEINGKPYT